MVLRHLRPTAAVLVGALLLAACSHSADNEGKGPGSTPSPWGDLEAAASYEVTDVGTLLAPGFWRTGDLVVVHGDERIVAHAAESGEQAWTWAPAGRHQHICQVSSTVNAQGLAAVRVGRNKEDGCEITAALDTTTGTLVWSHRSRLSSWRNTDDRVSISDTTLHSSGECGEVWRFAAHDGRQLRSLAPGDAACAHDSWHDDTTVSLVVAPLHADDVDTGTGWVHNSGKGTIRIEQWDATTRKRLWSRTAPNRAAGLTRVVSHDPEVWFAEDRGRTHLWLVEDGRFTTPLSPGLTTGDRLPLRGAMVDGLFVADYGDGTTRGFHPATGQEVSTTRQDRGVATSSGMGEHRGRLLGTTSRLDPDTGKYETWLQARAVRDGDDVLTLGRLPLASSRVSAHAIEENRLWLLLPPTGVEGRRRLLAVDMPQGVPGDPTLDEKAAEVRRVDPAAEACRSVSAGTLRLLDLPRPGLPAPLTCFWADDHAADGLERRISVSTTQMMPDPDSPDDADQKARDHVDEQRRKEPGTWAQLDDVADYAWLRSPVERPDDSAPSRVEATIVAQHGEVWTDVRVSIQSWESQQDLSGHREQVLRTAEAALADVVAALEE